MENEKTIASATCPNRDIILKEVHEHFNELVLMPGASIARLVGFHEGDDDYYYIVNNQHKRQMGPQNQTYLSCVGGLVYLKGLLPEHAYSHADSDAEYGGATRAHQIILLGPAAPIH